MKSFLYSALLVGTLTACKKEAAGPSATLEGPTWTLQSEVVVIAPKNGGASRDNPRSFSAGSFQFTYHPDGTFYFLEFGTQPDTGTFTLVGPTLTLTTNIVGGRAPRVRTVTELTAHKLVTVTLGEDSDNRYTDTAISTR